VRAGGISLVLQAMQQHETMQPVQEYACWALLELAVVPQHQV
jgi:hypothetical protein